MLIRKPVGTTTSIILSQTPYLSFFHFNGFVPLNRTRVFTVIRGLQNNVLPIPDEGVNDISRKTRGVLSVADVHMGLLFCVQNHAKSHILNSPTRGDGEILFAFLGAQAKWGQNSLSGGPSRSETSDLIHCGIHKYERLI